MIGGPLNALGLTVNLVLGDCRNVLPTLPAGSVHCCVTSPPYFGLRDYGHEAQIGLEETPDAFVAKLVEVFREVKRVLRDDGTLWLNLGDSYARAGGWSNNNGLDGVSRAEGTRAASNMTGGGGKSQKLASGLKSKDLIGIPWRVAFALQADGWYLRQDIIWHKPNPMPESARDRCTKAHEYIFLLSKGARYHFDSEAIKEPATKGATRNRRSVWTVTPKPYKGAHFATFPPDLIEPCILAGCPAGGTVLDPFMGSGTTAAVSLQHGRQFVGVELNPEYLELARRRVDQVSVDAEGTSSGLVSAERG
jgi:DNA modification methylase